MHPLKRFLYWIAGVAPISIPKTAALVAAVWWATRMDVDKAVDEGTSDAEKLRIVDTFQDELCRLIDGKMRRFKHKDSCLPLDFDYGPDPLLSEALRVAGISRSVWGDLWARKTRMTVYRHQLSVKPGYYHPRHIIPIGES